MNLRDQTRSGERRGALRRVLFGALLITAVILGLLTLHTHSVHAAASEHASMAAPVGHSGHHDVSSSAAPADAPHPAGAALASAATCLFILGVALLVALRRPTARPIGDRGRPRAPIAVMSLARQLPAPSLHFLCISRT